MRSLGCSLYLLAITASGLLAQPSPNKENNLNVNDASGRRYFKSEELSYTASVLKVMGESSLWTRKADDTATYIRWTWSRTFHAPVCIRLTKFPGKPAELIATTLTGKSGYDLGEIQSQKTIILSDSDWDKIQTWIQAKDFWAPLTEMEDAFLSFGTDGAGWDFEFSSRETYKILPLRSPEAFRLTLSCHNCRSGERYLTLGRLLLKMAKMHVEGKEFY